MSPAPLFPPLDDADWPDRLDHLRDSFATRLDVYRTMAHRPDLLAAWAPLRDHVVVKTALGAELSEIAILRIGHRAGSRYEWAHHVVRARALDMPDARIASVAGPLDGMATDDAVIAGAVDRLFDHQGLRPEDAEAVRALVGTDGLFDLIATFGFYMTLAALLKTAGTPVDADVAAALEARPFNPSVP
ncbi:carboxymuconolactone decarboxylase family protein [Roseivivax isoporae]|uniref:Carboxymuconolactone decarboxylase n=1 Tax=Roseivivax isoporae LMG 25204 TaxID=1449351 RepID=X7FES8_9RHOB|nr:carboxymuconolactone decarboxylase family protein [Roseivivax isoporae]ETX30551.1 carboxymuconolactone decarboxylase [Roseivivax isoporae LMG 25204]